MSEAAHTCGLGSSGGDGSADAPTTEEVALAAAEAYACLYRPTAGVGDGSGNDGPAHVFSLTLSALGAVFPLLVAEASTTAPAAIAARASAAAVLTRLATVAAAGLAALSIGGAPAAPAHSGGGGGASESKGDAAEAAAAPRLRWAAPGASEAAAGGAEEGAGGDELAARTLLAAQLLWEALAGLPLPAAAPEQATGEAVAAVIATARPALAVAWGVTLQVAAAAAAGAGAEGKEGEGGGLPAGLFADDEALVEAAAQLRDALEWRLAPQAPPA